MNNTALKKRALLIVNPAAGKGLIRHHILNIVQGISNSGYELVVHPTTRKGDAIDQMAFANQYQRVFVVGGDGTLSEVMDGLVRHNEDVPISYIPMGTMNDFATTLSLPKTINESLSISLGDSLVPIDLGLFNGRVFTYVAAFGALTDVSYETPQYRKKILGQLAYFVEGVMRLPTIPSHVCQIETSEQTIHGEFVFGMISNSNSVAGIQQAFGQQAHLNDGQFEVILIKKPKSLIDLQRILTNFINNKYDKQYVISFKTNYIKVASTTEMKWTLDGEKGGMTKEAEINILPRRANVVAPNYARENTN